MTIPDKTKPPTIHKTYGNPQRTDDETARHTLEPSRNQGENSDFHERLAKLAGFQAVSAVFARDPYRVIRLYFDEKMKKSVGNFCTQMARMQRPYRLVDESELQKISGTVLHGGVVAAVVPRLVPDFDLENAKTWAQSGQALVILDGIGNPHNLGAIARTMAYFGLKYLLISDHPAQAGLSDAAHRVAEGGLEHLEVYRAMGCAKVCKRLQEYYRVVGTALGGRAVELEKLPTDKRPLALVLGNEEHGLPHETLNACDATLIIPGSGRVQSLNVSATAAILIHQMAAKQPNSTPRKSSHTTDPKSKHVPQRQQIRSDDSVDKP